jgi:tryptophan aminotransferase
MKKNLDGLAEWNTPEAGLFFWFKLLLNSTDGSEGDSEDLIRTKALEKGVLALPGTAFLPNGRKSAYCRASFSLVPEEDIDEALKRLRTVLIQERSHA